MTDGAAASVVGGSAERVAWDGWTLACSYMAKGHLVAKWHDFTRHPLRGAVRDVIAAKLQGGSVPSSIAADAGRLLLLGDFMLAQDPPLTDLTPQGFNAMLTWLRTTRIPKKRVNAGQPYSENYQRRTVDVVLHLYETGVGTCEGWTRGALDDMARSAGTRFRGHNKRLRAAKIAAALSAEERRRLYRALRLEVEECEAALAAWREAEDPVPLGAMRFVYNPLASETAAVKVQLRPIDPNPYVCFGLLAALDMTLRADEFNALEVGDDRRYPDRLHVRPPPRSSADLRLPLRWTAAARRACELAVAWGEPLRQHAPASARDALLLWSRDLPRSYGGVSDDARVIKAARNVVSQFWVRRFVTKYLATTLPGEDRPVLYADPAPGASPDAPLRALDLTLQQARGIGLTLYAEIESDPEYLRRRAGHKHIATANNHYVAVEERDFRLGVAERLALMSERIRMTMAARVVTTPDGREAAAITARRAAVPVWTGDAATGPEEGGHCAAAAAATEAEALADGFERGCVRSGDCRACTKFRVHASRRYVYVAARDWKLEQVEALRTANDLREAENMRESAALDQAIIDCIDDHVRRTSA